MSTQPDVSASQPTDGSDKVIRTDDLTKVYPRAGEDGDDLMAVDHLDLTVGRGEIFGLLGPNGAGKTTTVGMLTTRVIPTEGTASIGGVDVVAEPARVKGVIGVVHQLNTLDRSLSVWENLYFHGRYFGMNNKQARTAADEALQKFRLTGRGKADVRALSGGMARRLMVARAFLHHPAVLFLDEPTAGLDPQSRLALWDILSELRAQGETILLTTHYMEEADRFCDRVAIIDRGRILALDTPARLKRAAGSAEGTTDRAKARLAQLRAMARAGEGPSAGSEARASAAGSGGRASAAGSGGRASAAGSGGRASAAGSGGEDGSSDPGDIEEAVLLEFLENADEVGGNIEELPVDVTLESVFINLTGRDLRE